MIRIVSMLVTLLLGVAPLAQAASCKDQMEEVSKLVDAAKDANKKQDAMQEMEKAKEALTKADESGCVAHVESARKKAVDVD